VVVDGGEHLSPAGPGEAGAIIEITRTHGRRAEPVRLACQARVLGDVVVSKYGVRPRAEQEPTEECVS
jgi:hypothetical protein